jgi:hypothetical protein
MRVISKNQLGDAAKYSRGFTAHNSSVYRPLAARLSLATLGIGLTVGLIGCGGTDGPVQPTLAPSFAVVKAKCGDGDHPETGLQGQIPITERVAGFKGFNCNLEKTSSSFSSSRESLYEQTAVMHDRSGHVCAYTGTAFQDTGGTKVVDVTNPNNIVETAVLKTPGMLNPGEGLRVHEERGLLVSGFYNGPTASAKEEAGGFDVYDVGTDCRHPQLLASTTRIEFSKEGIKLPPGATGDRVYGHEGAFSPDGLTYWVGDVPNSSYHAIDVADPTKPKYLASFQYPNLTFTPIPAGGGGAHGLSVSNDGNRAYPVMVGFVRSEPGAMVPQTGKYDDGFMVVDTSEIQARRPNPKMRMISSTTTRDTSGAQLTIPVTIAGNKYLVFVPEGGTSVFNTAGFHGACAAGKTPFAMPQIYYMGDENKPELINKLILESNDPKNCNIVAPEIDASPGPLSPFINWHYDVHHCTVDNRDNATTLACGYFTSGIRVFDIRDPRNIKEIAYFNPAAAKSGTTWTAWCASMPILDAKTGMLYSHCSDTGTVALKFKNGVWPFPESSTPPGKQL